MTPLVAAYHLAVGGQKFVCFTSRGLDVEQRMPYRHTIRRHLGQAMKHSKGGKWGRVVCDKCALTLEWTRCE